MNDDLQKALAEILKKTTQGVEAGVGFLQRELPDVVQQILIWHGVNSAIFFVLGLAILAYCPWKSKKLWDKGTEVENANKHACVDGYIYGVLTCWFLSAVGLVIVFTNLTWLQILIAPKLYLIEYAASLVK